MTTYSASTNAQLTTALNSAASGDRIELTAGASLTFFEDSTTRNYGPSGIVITSANLSNKATVAGFNLKNWSYVTIKDMNVPWSVTQNAAFVLDQADSNITLDGLTMNGGADPSHNAVVVIDGATTLTIKNCTIYNARNGILVGSTVITNGLNIIGNEVYGIYENGMYITRAKTVEIAYNDIHDFTDPGDGSHADAIQVEKSSGTGSNFDDIYVHHNKIWRGSSSYPMQGVFCGNDPSYGIVFNRPKLNWNGVQSPGQSNSVYIWLGQNGEMKNNFGQGTSAGGQNVVVRHSDLMTVTNNQMNLVDDTNTNLTASGNSAPANVTDGDYTALAAWCTTNRVGLAFASDWIGGAGGGGGTTVTPTRKLKIRRGH